MKDGKKYIIKRAIKNFSFIFAIIFTAMISTGCELSDWEELDSGMQDLKGSIKGCTYNCWFLDDYGSITTAVEGQNIDIKSNIVKEQTYDSDGGWGYVKTLSSIITIIIDGHEIESCGTTVLFQQDDLRPDVDFEPITHIESESSDSLTDWTYVAGIVNQYRNSFGKSRVVVVLSESGEPVYAYSGDDVYWELCQDLPKTTKIMIDGKALYIHRAKFLIIDKELLD